jgi:hypothetical protein
MQYRSLASEPMLLLLIDDTYKYKRKQVLDTHYYLWHTLSSDNIILLAAIVMTLPGFHTIDRMTVCSYETGQRSGPLTLADPVP